MYCKFKCIALTENIPAAKLILAEFKSIYTSVRIELQIREGCLSIREVAKLYISRPNVIV